MTSARNNALKNVYLVGGAVRDKLLNIPSKDQDFVVVGATREQMEALGFVSVGKDFPVFLHPETKHEYALARTEKKTGSGYTGFTVNASQDVSLVDDLTRRDLSINAMALNDKGQLFDPFKGQDDLNNKVLRHTSAAFVEDPLRVLRLARFYARFGEEWRIHPETKALVHKIKQSGELAHLVAERIWQETYKALQEEKPHLYFECLDSLGVLDTLFPELSCMKEVPQPPLHHPEGDVFVHTMLVLQRATELGYDLPTRFAALTHDFGKAICYQKHGNLHGHEEAGIEIIDAFCKRLRIPNKFRSLAMLTSDNHLRCHKIFELKPKTIHKMMVINLNGIKQSERFIQFLHACQCDAQGRGPTKVNTPYIQADLAKFLLQGLCEQDTKEYVQNAIKNGKQGPAIGEAIRLEQIALIARKREEFIAIHKN